MHESELKSVLGNEDIRNQSDSTSDVQSEVVRPVKQRIKLKDESEGPKESQTEMKLTGYSTAFTEGETTVDELDDEIIENTIYIYKVKVQNK